MKRLCLPGIFFCHIVLNKITMLIFQIHIQNKTLNPCVNSQWRSWTKVWGPNSSPESFYLFTLTTKRKEALQTKVHKVWTEQKEGGIVDK